MRSPNQGLGSIPASKKWGSGSDPRINNMMLWDWSLRILGLIPEPHFLTLGLIPEPQVISFGFWWKKFPRFGWIRQQKYFREQFRQLTIAVIGFVLFQLNIHWTNQQFRCKRLLQLTYWIVSVHVPVSQTRTVYLNFKLRKIPHSFNQPAWKIEVIHQRCQDNLIRKYGM